MKKKITVLPFLILIGICAFFFYKTIFLGLLPFPGDLLVAEYSPWKTESFLGFLPGTMPNKAQYFDVLRQLYPWKTLVLESLKMGQMPLWNPYNFSGSPLLANVQSAVMYPLNVIYFLLPQRVGWSLLIILQPFLASVFMYSFVRKKKFSIIASLFSAIAYGYSLFMSVFLEYNTLNHVILWLPLSMYAVELLLEAKTFFRSLVLVSSITFGFFAGHLQLAVINVFFVALYIAVRLFQEKKYSFHEIFYFLFLFILGIGIALVQLIPTLELLLSAARSPQEHAFLMRELLLQPYQLIKFFSPDIFGNPATKNYLLSDPYPGKALYIGLIPLVFALYAMGYVKKRKDIAFFLWVCVVLLLLLLAHPLTAIFYSMNIPFFSTSSPSNAIYIVSFSLAFLSGIGIDLWVSEKQKKGVWYLLLTVWGLFILLFLFIPLSGHQFMHKNLLYTILLLTTFSFFFVISSLRFIHKRYILVALLLITILDLFYFFHKFNPFVSPLLVFPDTSITTWLSKHSGIDRVWGIGSGRVEANFATQYQFFSPDGYDPLYPKWYGSFILASEDGNISGTFTNLTRSDAVVAPASGNDIFSENIYRKKILNLLGVKYILDRNENLNTQKAFPVDTFSLVYEEKGWKIYENKQALLRVALFSDYEIYQSDDVFTQKFFRKDFDIRKTLLLPETPNETIAPGNGTVEVFSYTPNEVRLKTNASSGKLLFLSDTYMPGWKALVDGKETKIYKANYAFRAIALPGGAHEVVFRYEPGSFSFGSFVTILSIVGLLGYGFLSQRKMYEK